MYIYFNEGGKILKLRSTDPVALISIATGTITLGCYETVPFALNVEISLSVGPAMGFPTNAPFDQRVHMLPLSCIVQPENTTVRSSPIVGGKLD